MAIKINTGKQPQPKQQEAAEVCLKRIAENLSLEELNQLSRAIPQLKKSTIWGMLKSYISKY